MGTPDFAVPALNRLIKSNHEIIAVYTQKPKAAGRGMEVKKSKVHEVAEANNIKVYTPDSLKSDEEKNNFKNLNADIAVVAAYGMLLPKEILQGTKHGCINIHPSLLPRWRGAAPLQRTIMAGDNHTAVCIMQMNEGLDTGDIILKEEFDIPDSTNVGWLHDKCAEIGAELTLKAIEQISTGTAKYIKQSEQGVTYAKKITKEDEKIDFNKNGNEILNQIRGLSPYMGANFILNNKKHKIFEAEFILFKNTSDELGKILNDQFHISCKDGCIVPKTIQKEGSKKMSIEEFLRGNKTPVGTIIS